MVDLTKNNQTLKQAEGKNPGTPTENALYPHQLDIINAAYGKKAFAVFADCGLGKTACAIKLIERYLDLTPEPGKMYPLTFKTLVVAPNTILENWYEEIKKWSTLTCIILQGNRLKRTKLLQENADIYVINYEALRIFEPYLIAAKFQFIIADELQKLKGYRSLQSKAAFRIAQMIPYRLGMTGTPITNNLCDVFAEYRFLNPYIFGFSFYGFRARYCTMGGYMMKEIRSYINVDELQRKVASIAIRVSKFDCLKLPEKIYQTHYVDLNDEQQRVYKELRKEFISEIQGKTVTAPYVLTRLMRLSQVTAGFIKAEDQEEINFESNPKLRFLKEFIEDLPKEDKVVVFCRFLKEIANLRALCEEQQWPWAGIWGEVKDRQDQIKRFNESAKVMIAQIQTAGLGINLQAAHCCVFLSNSYSHGDRLQAEERCHRIGQCSNVLYIDIIARKTIDETILQCLKDKKDLAQQILEEINEKDTGR